MDERKKYCCYAFKQALQSGTDGEAYGSLISLWNGEYQAGCGNPPVKFCPFCGKKLDAKKLAQDLR